MGKCNAGLSRFRVRAVALGMASVGVFASAAVLPVHGETLVQALGDDGRVSISRVEVTGVHAFDAAAIEALVSKHTPTGNIWTPVEIDALRLEITNLYVSSGYVSSGALVEPGQDVSAGVLSVKVVEGALGNVKVSGNGWLAAAYVESRARLGASTPFNMEQFGQRLQIMLQDPVIGTVNAKVKPGAALGVADIDLELTRGRMIEATASVANSRSPSIGAVQSDLGVVFRNVTGWGDAVTVNGSYSAGLSGGGVSISLPLAPNDIRLNASVQVNDTLVIEEPFDAIDIEGTSLDYEIGVVWPLFRTPLEEVNVGASLVHRESRTTLLGSPFSFSPGVVNGEAKLTALKLSQAWNHRFSDGIFAARSVVTLGLDLWNDVDPVVCSCPPAVKPGPDGVFAAWMVQLQLAQRLKTGLETGDLSSLLIARIDGQLAEDSLLPMEKLSIGGVDTVRGFRSNTLVRDSGVTMSAELRIPVFRFQLLSDGTDPAAGAFELAAFADYGFAADRNDSTSGLSELYSTGLGFRWEPIRTLSTEFYYGQDLQNVPDPAVKALVDRGIHFRVGMNVGEVIDDLLQ